MFRNYQSLRAAKWHATADWPLWVAVSLIPVVVFWSLGNTEPEFVTRGLVRPSIVYAGESLQDCSPEEGYILVLMFSHVKICARRHPCLHALSLAILLITFISVCISKQTYLISHTFKRSRGNLARRWLCGQKVNTKWSVSMSLACCLDVLTHLIV